MSNRGTSGLFTSFLKTTEYVVDAPQSLFYMMLDLGLPFRPQIAATSHRPILFAIPPRVGGWVGLGDGFHCRTVYHKCSPISVL